MVETKSILKEEIKSLAKEIKETKAAHKAAQRAYSKQWHEGEYDSMTWYHQPEKYHQIEPTLRFINSTRNEADHLSYQFRVKHIVNSMCKGRTISQIEPVVSQDNPNKVRERKNVYEDAKKFLQEIGKEWLD